MLVRVLLAALLAGVLAGAFATAAQSVRVIPLILEAEKLEGEAGDDHHASKVAPKLAPVEKQESDHAHENEHDNSDGHHDETNADGHHSGDAWAPQEGFERLFYTFVSNVVAGVAFSLILTAAILVSRQQISLQSGLVWGAAGFVSFVLAPNLGLTPELPGMPAADLHDRQIWWLATVLCTAGGIAFMAFSKKIPLMAVGAVLIALPHIYGAPMPKVHETAVPAMLAVEFVVATIVTSGLFWLVLGGALGNFLQRALNAEAKDRINR